VIRVMVASASAVVRAGLEALVASSPSLELAGSYSDLSSVEVLHPDVVLAALALDDLSPPGNGRSPAVVLLSAEAQPAFTHEAFRMGVRAVLPRDVSSAAIVAAVESAAEGLSVIDTRDLEPLLAAGEHSHAAAQAASGGAVLTPRELEVLRLLAEGAANKNIAWRLGISEHTVKFHVASVLSKLNAGSRTEAVTAGIRKGLVLL